MEEDDILLSQAMESLEQSNPQEFFCLPCYDDVELSQMCVTLEKDAADDIAEKINVSEFLGIDRNELNDVLADAVDCTNMLLDGGCDAVSSWKYPKVKCK